MTTRRGVRRNRQRARGQASAEILAFRAPNDKPSQKVKAFRIQLVRYPFEPKWCSAGLSLSRRHVAAILQPGQPTCATILAWRCFACRQRMYPAFPGMVLCPVCARQVRHFIEDVSPAPDHLLELWCRHDGSGGFDFWWQWPAAAKVLELQGVGG